MSPGEASASAGTGRDRRSHSLRWFLALQFAALVFLQKFGLQVGSFWFGVPMLALFGGVGWLLLAGHARIDGNSLLGWLAFIACAGFSQLLAPASSSMASFMLVASLYGLMCLRIDEPGLGARVAEDALRMLLLPAAIVMFQVAWQRLVRGGNPLDMNQLVPSAMLMPGFVYQGVYHWGGSFVRPNGFFFLETSFASAFLACATLVDFDAGWRRWRPWAFLLATLATLGGTGMVMLACGLPMIVAKLPRSEQRAVLVGAIVSLALAIIGWLAFFPDASLPFLSRLTEFDRQGSSGSGRLLIPAQQLIALLGDPAYLLAGSGAGSIDQNFGSAWPMVKVAKEYGVLAMLTFTAFLAVALRGLSALPLKFALGVTFFFTGGYLLSPVMVELMLLSCVVVSFAARDSDDDTTADELNPSRLRFLASHAAR